MVYDYYWMGMIPVGFIFLIVGQSLIRKSRLFIANYEGVEARITKIKRSQSSHSGRHRGRRPVYTPYAEYIVDGRMIRGKHFIPVRHKFIRFREGDIVTVKVNRKKPEIFCIDTVDGPEELAMGRKMFIFGVIVVAGASFMMFIRR